MLFLQSIVLPHNYLLRNCYLQQLSAHYIEAPAEEFDIESAATEAASGGEHSAPESFRWAAARQPVGTLYRRCTACQEHVRFFDTAEFPAVMSTVETACKSFFVTETFRYKALVRLRVRLEHVWALSTATPLFSKLPSYQVIFILSTE
jgi:hypothetical protein